MRYRLRVVLASLVVVAASSGCPNDVAAPCAPADPTCVQEGAEPPRIYVDPPFGLGFTCVTLGCDETKPLTIENRGGGVVKLSLVRLSVDSATDFSASMPGAELPQPEAQAELKAGEQLIVDVRYAPSDGVSDDGVIWIDWYDGALAYEDAPVERVEIPLSARVIGNAAARTAVDGLDFGYVAVGAASTLDFVVTNDGDAVLQVGPAAIDATSAAAFTVAPPVGAADGTAFVNPGEAATVQVTFSPTLPDAAFGTLIVQTNDPARTRIEVPLQGTAIADPRVAVLDAAQGVVDFGEVRVATERLRDVIVKNLGGQPLEVTPHLLSGASAGYAVEGAAGDARATIQPLAEATFVVALRPNVGGPLPGRLALTTNDPTQPEPALDLTAYGAAPDALVEPASVDFGAVVQGWTTEARTITVRNTGTGELTVSGVSFEIGSSSQIQLASVPALPIKISPDEPPIEVVVYVQATTVGPADAVLIIETDAIGAGEGVRRVPISAVVVTCEEGCPTTNGTPDCSLGRCEIGACLASYHDADQTASTGCECQEDRVGVDNVDIGAFCGVGSDLGTLYDDGTPQSVTREGTLHAVDDVDQYFFKADDTSQFLDDDYGAEVELVDPPPGLQLCTRFVSAGNGCGGENQRQCGATKYRGRGHGTSDDSEDVTVWVEWAPGAAPMCGAYQIKFRADANF